MIGATTLDEYRKYIEKDAALERRFQPVMVDQPSVEDTISILRGLQGEVRSASRRAHQGCRARRGRDAEQPLHHRPLLAGQGDRSWSTKSAAKLRTEIDSMPQELDEVSRRMMQLEIEREALRKESDDASRRRLEQLEKELASLARRSDAPAHALGRGEERRRQAALAARSDRADEGADRTGRASVRSQQSRRAALRHAAEAAERARSRGAAPRA